MRLFNPSERNFSPPIRRFDRGDGGNSVRCVQEPLYLGADAEVLQKCRFEGLVNSNSTVRTAKAQAFVGRGRPEMVPWQSVMRRLLGPVESQSYAAVSSHILKNQCCSTTPRSGRTALLRAV